MIEILVTLVVLSIGLLGVAGMQASGLRNNHAAYTKTQAANLVMDMADRIRANPKGRASYAGFDTSDAIPDNPGCISSNNGCNPQQLAAYDLYEWSIPILGKNSQDMETTKPVLPQGRGVISQNNGGFTVTVLWNEPDIQGVTPNKCVGFEAESNEIACFQMRFIP